MGEKSRQKHGGSRAGAGRKKLEKKLVRKNLHLSEEMWKAIDQLSIKRFGELLPAAKTLRLLLEEDFFKKQASDRLNAVKKKPRAVAKVRGYQGDETGFTERQLDFIVDHLSRIYHGIGTMLLLCNSEKEQYKRQGLYQESVALEMVLEALDDRVFSDRLERIKTPKGVDAEAITDMLIGD